MSTDDTGVYDTDLLPAVPEWDEKTLAALGDDSSDVAWYDHGDSATIQLHTTGQVANQQVYRALQVMFGLAGRGKADGEIARRGAAVLLYDPGTSDGTPLRCPTCQRVYTGPAGPPDWDIAGSEHADCIPCALAAPRHARKTAAKRAAVRPSLRKRDALGRKHGPDGRFLKGSTS